VHQCPLIARENPGRTPDVHSAASGIIQEFFRNRTLVIACLYIAKKNLHRISDVHTVISVWKIIV